MTYACLKVLRMFKMFFRAREVGKLGKLGRMRGSIYTYSGFSAIVLFHRLLLYAVSLEINLAKSLSTLNNIFLIR